MAPRIASRPGRENDYSNIGISGRRTGLVLPKGRLDANGIEEIVGIFSSPRKPSPLRKTYIREDKDEEHQVSNQNHSTPKTTRSTRKTPVARSASPRKSGISGTAKRNNAIHVLGVSREKENQIISPQNLSKAPALSATPAFVRPGDVSKATEATSTTRRNNDNAIRARSSSAPLRDTSNIQSSVLREDQENFINREASQSPELSVSPSPVINENIPLMNDDFLPAPIMYDEEDIDGDDNPEPTALESTRVKEPTIANSRRKRKSDVIEQDLDQDITSSPAAKRAKRISEETAKSKNQARISSPVNVQPSEKQQDHQSQDKQEKSKSSSKFGLKLPAKIQDRVNEVVEKIKSRPGQKKSLYILRRESRSHSVAQTRSGRISVKPLAYWRNERCVFGGSPGGSTLEDGARFPLNRITEIIRADEVDSKPSKKRAKGKKQPKNGIKSKRKGTDPETMDADVDVESSEDEPEVEQDTLEPWEIESGTFKGRVSTWNSEMQAAESDDEETIDIAYAAGAIQTKGVDDSSFRYAKLVSTKFFGSGLVELPPGAVKKPKNSRKMLMSFFVASGRVSVIVGPLGGPENKFSIGKGGFWQVPRGNQYSIANEHQRTATIFFSQGCEQIPQEYEYDG